MPAKTTDRAVFFSIRIFAMITISFASGIAELKYYSECGRVPYGFPQTIKLAIVREPERIFQAHQKFQLFISGITVLLFSNETKFELAAMCEIDDLS
jgi:hypothetical protein